MQRIKFGKYTIDHNGIKDESWPERDNLPTEDPIGDICETNASVPLKDGVYDPYVEGYKKWKKDQEAYNKNMKPHLIARKGKDVDPEDFRGYPTVDKCNCGTETVYGKVPISSHSHYCQLVTGESDEI